MRISTRLVIAMLSFTISLPVAAQKWSWPEKPENLQVLPKDWPGERLRPVMTGFTRALGVRCSHCHVGEEGKPLSTYDFASDENPNKGRARAMLKMLGMINEELKKIEPSGDKRVNMWCHTCHRGRPRPMSLSEELGEVYRKSGADAAISQYGELEAKFLRLGAYRFDEGALNSLGYEALRAEDVDGAIAIFRANTEAYPDSGNVWDSYGEALMKTERLDEARTAYEKSLELDPDNENAKKKLEEIAAKQ